MSDATARAVRLVKAQGIREAAGMLLNHLYDSPESAFERNYNFATRDAINRLTSLATEMEFTK